MSQNNESAKAIKKSTDNERHYDKDLIDILSEKVGGVFKSLIADKNLLRLVLAHAYAKECARNHRNGTFSEDLAKSIGIVEEMIVDCLCGSNPEYREIFDEEEDDEGDIDSDDNPDNLCNGCYGESCRGCCADDFDKVNTIPRFEVVEGHLIITFVGRDGDA